MYAIKVYVIIRVTYLKHMLLRAYLVKEIKWSTYSESEVSMVNVQVVVACQLSKS